MMFARRSVGKLWLVGAANKWTKHASIRRVSLIAREIITGNDSSLLGEWRDGKEINSSISNQLLTLIHHNLVGWHKDHRQVDEDLWQSVSSRPKDGWTEYEKHLFAAANALINEGNFLKAAISLETIASSITPEPAVLRLTQELFLLAGRPDLLLKAVIRYPSCFHVSDNYRPSVFGMLGVGYAEVGKFQESDEIARKSRAMSTENDVNLISAIIDGHNLSGKSSEVKTVIDEELGKYENTGGLSLMQCGQAAALLIRGNINFSYNELVGIFDVNNNKNAATHDPNFVYNMPLLMKASHLLLQVLINLSPKHFMELDRLAALMNKQLLKHSPDHRYYDLIHTIILSTRIIAVETMNHSKYLKVKPVVEAPPSTSLWASIFGSAKPKRRVHSIPPPSPETPLSTQPTEESSPSPSDTLREQEGSHWHGQLDALIHAIESKLQYESQIRPILPPMKEGGGISSLYFVNQQLVDPISITNGVDILCLAIAHFAKKQYSSAAQLLALLYQRNYHVLGFRVAQRDVINQLFIET
jgi:hypothetical protein